MLGACSVASIERTRLTELQLRAVLTARASELIRPLTEGPVYRVQLPVGIPLQERLSIKDPSIPENASKPLLPLEPPAPERPRSWLRDRLRGVSIGTRL